jgi:release factor glutamine methyltransferase
VVQVVFSAEMKTLSDYKQNALVLLSTIYGARESANIVNYWIEARLGLSRMDQFLKAEEVFLFDSYEADLKELTDRKPIQYVVGHAYFHGLEIGLNSSTLIPRPETEELVNEVVKLIDATQAKRIIDLGTGSGCIALAIKSIRPDVEVVGFDNNSDAIDQARRNAETLGLHVNFVVADLFNYSFDSADIIVSNPPYIPTSECENMEEHVIAHEPEGALFVPDEQPLLFYDAIFALGKEILSNRVGWMVFEIHHLFGEEMQQLGIKYCAKEVKLIQDLQGKDRMLLARYGRTT